MKRLDFLLILVLLVSVTSIAAQTPYDDFADGFEGFAEALASELPFNTAIGLNWADAYIGQFPHFGIGLTVGITLIPFTTFNKALVPMGVDLEAQLGSELGGLGFPLPAAVLDARIGGFVLPFDIGFKIGYLPTEAKVFLPPNMDLDYLLVGGDIRYAVVQEKGWLPDISVGLGYSFLRGSVAISGIMGGNQQIAEVRYGPGAGDKYTLELQDPNVFFNWQASTIDLKVQVSKSLLIFTPFVGFGAAHGWSSVGGGLQSGVLIGGSPITDTQIQQIKDYYDLIGEPVPDLSTDGILINSITRGWAYRAFGGISLNIFILRLNLNGMYNFTTGALGASLNGSVQF